MWVPRERAHRAYRGHRHAPCRMQDVSTPKPPVALRARSREEAVSLLDVTDDYSFIAYRKFDGGVVWVDELYTTERARGRGIARWLLSQVARGQRVELQVSCDTGHMAERARRSYRSMGIDRMRRGRSRVVESAEDGYELWFTEAYCVTSGWLGSRIPSAMRWRIPHGARSKWGCRRRLSGRW